MPLFLVTLLLLSLYSGRAQPTGDCDLEFCLEPSCNATGTQCLQCEPGYFIDNDDLNDPTNHVCSPCPPCSRNSWLQTPCSGGLEVDQVCAPCQTKPFCINQLICGPNTTCPECWYGFEVNENGDCRDPNLISACPVPIPDACIQGHCRSVDNIYVEVVCTQCAEGWTLNEDHYCVEEGAGCAQIPFCVQETVCGVEPRCPLCFFGFELSDNGTCVDPNLVSPCPVEVPEQCLGSHCTASGDDVLVICQACVTGWHLDDNHFCVEDDDVVCGENQWLNGTVCLNCTVCPESQFPLRSCSPDSDTVCINDCPARQYWFAPATCFTCDTCEAGEYISGVCEDNRNTECSACRGCPEGQVDLNPCNGNSNTDTTNCQTGGGNTGCDITNCLTVDCWTEESGPVGRCTQCADGWWIDANGNCAACRSCQLGEFISYPCEGYTNTVCTPCTPCDAGRETIALCPGTGNTDSTVCADTNSCPLPENCLTSDCWPSDEVESGLQVQCTQCADGFWINSSWTCEPCQNCDVGEFISYPCGGWTPTICSPCTACDFGEDPVAPCPGTGNTDSTVCDNCLPGYAQQPDGTCQPRLCQLYGCGVSNIGATCSEINATSFLCTCPDGNYSVVNAGGVFSGCNEEPPTDEQVVAAINVTSLEAFLVRGVLEIRGVILVSVAGNTFTLNIDTTVPVDNISDQLREKIAAFLGGSYTADDVTLNYGSKKRDGDNLVDITIGGDPDSAPSVYNVLLAFSAFLAYSLA